MGTDISSAEWVVLHGANAVGSAPREHFPSPQLPLGIAVLVFVLSLVLLRRRRNSWLVAGLLVAAAPGAVVLLGVRADAPLHRPQLAGVLRRTLDDLRKRSPWPSAEIQVVHEDDDVLFPLGRYALPSRFPTTSPKVRLELRGASLAATCRSTGPGAVICGAP